MLKVARSVTYEGCPVVGMAGGGAWGGAQGQIEHKAIAELAENPAKLSHCWRALDARSFDEGKKRRGGNCVIYLVSKYWQK